MGDFESDVACDKDNGNANCHPPHTCQRLTMASKYAFGAGLKELRFLFCQTSEHSAATRYALHHIEDSGSEAHSMALRKEPAVHGTMLTNVCRNFLTKSYPTMKKHNPHTPIMIREASGTEPTVYARFGASHMRDGLDQALTVCS